MKQVSLHKDRKSGYVYLVKAQGHPWYKIGRAFILDRRVTQLRVLYPFKIRFVHSIACADCIKAEKRLHKRFKRYHLNGEWFELPREEVAWFKDILCHPNGSDVAAAFAREKAGPIITKLPKRRKQRR